MPFASFKKSKITMKEGVAEERGRNGRYRCAYAGCDAGPFPSQDAMTNHIYETHRKGERRP